MISFITKVLLDLQKQNVNFSDITFVLPSRRAGVFLRKELSNIINKTSFSPTIISIESFVEELSQLKTLTNTELLFQLYNSYIELTPKEEQEPFDVFSKWGQILLQDFNEIDRHLIPQKNIFEYLSAIKDLDHWSLNPNPTDVVNNYIKFWNKLYPFYKHFSKSLINQKKGYQGLIYREAVENLETYIQSCSKRHIFTGFNALNTAEETIIQELLQNDLAAIYWDIDKIFIDSSYHDAGLFTRKHKENWKYFQKNSFNWKESNYSTLKNINIFGVPKAIGQAKTIGNILNSLSEKDIKNTAVVLGDENLLLPTLNSIPKHINAINVTMGFPLKSIPLAALFEKIFSVQINNTKNYYHKDVIDILKDQYLSTVFNNNYTQKIVDIINTNNIIYLSKEKLLSLSINNEENNIINLIFSNWNNNPTLAIQNSFKLIQLIKNKLIEDRKSNQLSLEYLYRFNVLFNEIDRLNSKYNTLTNIRSLYNIYKELLSSETLDFQGEPLQGLQIMGMLESRVLDFETVIITNVNEGVLPSGKTNNSFIPFDVKVEKKLPTYKEKDAVYTYHFYHLLQRAKNVYILYNTEIDSLLGCEKSRFISQLELEGIHQINHQIISPEVPNYQPQLLEVKKSEALIDQIKRLANSGFSPSSLTSYIRNPIDFYNQKILGVKDVEEAEENVAANTLGTVVHNTLEALYLPLMGRILTVDDIKNLIPKIEKYITKFFKDEYKEGDITKGKNLIVFEIAKRYVLNFLNFEIDAIKSGNEIKIIALEEKIEGIKINIESLNFDIHLKGTVDRIDTCNGMTRIIDYKTGKVEQTNVTVVNWEDLPTDYKKYSKSFQVLMYAYMLSKKTALKFPVEAGIISFKNLSEGFIKFAKRESSRGKKDTNITEDTLSDFEVELKKLITEICNLNIPFTEKEV
ncbi:PD-(D/E)XK nuclease family protein [Mesoflavibacter sp. CH_XMU1422-2]|uniref:PD-(D/E)XK nuclease family protein n=1 Tax=Mesoflavibacter sp. CH_XMU1422-2 TaxID=3107770 RepID=UPI00300A01BE